jgi:hypothetical protein
VLAPTLPLALVPPSPALAILPARRLIRPPDPKLSGETGLRIGRYSNAETTRILLHCFLRDAHTAIDLTHGAGRFWADPYPPGLTIVTNNIDPEAQTDLHVDFTATGIPDGSYDVAAYDPPHLPHLGATSFFATRYGTVRSTDGFQAMIEAGVREAWRISRVGIIVKLTDAPNGGAYLPLTSWAYEALRAEPCYVMHIVGRPTPRPAGEEGQAPRNNGADWLVFRHDGKRYPSFNKLYERQVSRFEREQARLQPPRPCRNCDALLPEGGRRHRLTCSDRCRTALKRSRRLAAGDLS